MNEANVDSAEYFDNFWNAEEKDLANGTVFYEDEKQKVRRWMKMLQPQPRIMFEMSDCNGKMVGGPRLKIAMNGTHQTENGKNVLLQLKPSARMTHGATENESNKEWKGTRGRIQRQKAHQDAIDAKMS